MVRNAGALRFDSNYPSLLKGARQGLAFLCNGDGRQLEETPGKSRAAGALASAISQALGLLFQPLEAAGAITHCHCPGLQAASCGASLAHRPPASCPAREPQRCSRTCKVLPVTLSRMGTSGDGVLQTTVPPHCRDALAPTPTFCSCLGPVWKEKRLPRWERNGSQTLQCLQGLEAHASLVLPFAFFGFFLLFPLCGLCITTQ